MHFLFSKQPHDCFLASVYKSPCTTTAHINILASMYPRAFHRLLNFELEVTNVGLSYITNRLSQLWALSVDSILIDGPIQRVTDLLQQAWLSVGRLVSYHSTYCDIQYCWPVCESLGTRLVCNWRLVFCLTTISSFQFPFPFLFPDDRWNGSVTLPTRTNCGNS